MGAKVDRARRADFTAVSVRPRDIAARADRPLPKRLLAGVRLLDHWFYVPNAKGLSAVTLDGDEARHALRALRVREGETLQWVDGRGGRYRGCVRRVGKRELHVDRVTATEPAAAPPPLTLAVGALHDAARVEWLVEKACELGATDVHLLRTARVERARYRLARLRAKAISAMKQSGRAYLTTVAEASLHEFLETSPPGYIAHCHADLPRVPLSTAGGEGPNYLLLGPEGDFTPEEVALAEAGGWTAVSLGTARLRTETAALKGLVLLGDTC